jgi:hypothetical protein
LKRNYTSPVFFIDVILQLQNTISIFIVNMGIYFI